MCRQILMRTVRCIVHRKKKRKKRTHTHIHTYVIVMHAGPVQCALSGDHIRLFGSILFSIVSYFLSLNLSLSLFLCRFAFFFCWKNAHCPWGWLIFIWIFKHTCILAYPNRLLLLLLMYCKMHSNEISLYVVLSIHLVCKLMQLLNYVSRHIERQIALRKSIFTKVPQQFSAPACWCAM